MNTEVIRQILLAELKAAESTVRDSHGRHVAYDDKTGKAIAWPVRGTATIGWGRNLERGLSDSEAELCLANDIQEAGRYARAYSWFGDLDVPRQIVVICMLFNLGPLRFDGFRRMRAAIARGDFVAAKREMLDSKWVDDVEDGVGGEFGRAERYAEAMLTGALWKM